MRRNLSGLLLVLSFILAAPAPIYAESAVYHVGTAPQEDAYASSTNSTGVNGNGYNYSPGYQYFGYTSGCVYNAYWRWEIDVPKGASITNAYVMIRSDWANVGDLSCEFSALVPDGRWNNENAFHPFNYPSGTALNDIPQQGTPVSWDNLPDWTLGTWYTSPDISTLVQARIDNPDYDPLDERGKYFGLVLAYVSGSSYRVSTQEPDDDSFTAQLYVEWTPGPPLPPPIGAESVFYIAGSPEEDTFASSGVSNTNFYNFTYGWQSFGYASNTWYTSYWRWALSIPPGANITEAYVKIRSDYTNTGYLDAAFQALQPDGKWETAAGFSTLHYPNGTSLNAIPRLGNPVFWNDLPGWSMGMSYYSPDLSQLVQERIDAPDYDPLSDEGKYFGLVLYHVAGNSYRTGTQEPDSDTYTARLHVKWIACEDMAEICDDGIDNNCNGEVDENCNEPPVAVAGGNQEAAIGNTVELDGTASYDPDGDDLYYSWAILSAPAQQVMTLAATSGILSNPTSPKPTLSVDEAGEYIVQLVVSDGSLESQPDTCIITVIVPDYQCPEGLGYWKNHSDNWPVASLMLGNEAYEQEALLALLKMPVKGDASLILARQLIAAKLNIENVSDPFPIREAIADADDLLEQVGGILPCQKKPSGEIGRQMLELAQELESYNQGTLTPDCN
jgi:hypothetical protein